jgi:hypothetical protein
MAMRAVPRTPDGSANLNLAELTMDTRKDAQKTPEPKKTNKDQVDLHVEELEERIAPMKLR